MADTMADSKADSKANSVSSHCATCDTPTAIKCGGCSITVYCGQKCQAEDWPTHKKICGDLLLERMLIRVAELVQEAYITFRKNTWLTTITKVEDRDDTLVIHEGDPRSESVSQVFIKFPQDLVPDNPAAQLGVFTVWMCNELYAFMHTLIVRLVDEEDLRRAIRGPS